MEGLAFTIMVLSHGNEELLPKVVRARKAKNLALREYNPVSQLKEDIKGFPDS